jgi:hypothetical protein
VKELCGCALTSSRVVINLTACCMVLFGSGLSQWCSLLVVLLLVVLLLVVLQLNRCQQGKCPKTGRRELAGSWRAEPERSASVLCRRRPPPWAAGARTRHKCAARRAASSGPRCILSIGRVSNQRCQRALCGLPHQHRRTGDKSPSTSRNKNNLPYLVKLARRNRHHKYLNNPVGRARCTMKFLPLFFSVACASISADDFRVPLDWFGAVW